MPMIESYDVISARPLPAACSR